MGTKTIYPKGGRRDPATPFNDEIRRTAQLDGTVTAGAFLLMLRQRRVHFTDDEIARIEDVKLADAPPEDKWAALTTRNITSVDIIVT